MNTDSIKKLLTKKIEQGTYTGCALIFGKPFDKQVEVYLGQIGKNINQEINSDTVFDLQSITKAIVTGPLALRLTSSGQLRLDQKLGPI